MLICADSQLTVGVFEILRKDTAIASVDRSKRCTAIIKVVWLVD